MFFTEADGDEVQAYIDSGEWPGGEGQRAKVLPYNPAALEAMQAAMGGK